MTDTSYDVIVVGGGHAGCEAALAAARMGARTLLVTQSMDTIGQMSCNPAIGGIGKSHLVKELDALDGAMALAADHAGIQFRVLNASKGPAVRATRAQIDRSLYRQHMRQVMDHQSQLQIFQQGVDDLIVENGRCVGVVTQMGWQLRSQAVILTVGTFLGGRIHLGDHQLAGGRAGDPPANALAQRLRSLDLPVGRLKTGTPPRVDRRTVNWDVLEHQPGDGISCMSYLGRPAQHPRQVSCAITRTTSETKAIITANLHRSAMVKGHMEGVGPRYCPSIEDKYMRFDHETHNVFVEPEGLDVNELYLNGMSTSLPFEVQEAFVRSLPGFEQAHITRPGYAIEYDFFDPRALQPDFQTRVLPHLFFAGQINGTTGYEEAGAQGLYAAMHAVRLVRGESPCTLGRDQAYLGVMIDDLRTQGAPEPYRMFTSRAEYRLSLRQDNADLRLTRWGRDMGLVRDERWQAFLAKESAIEALKTKLKASLIRPGSDCAQRLWADCGQQLAEPISAWEMLKRPEVRVDWLVQAESDWEQQVHDQVDIQCQYDGYLQRQERDIAQAKRHERLPLPSHYDYQCVAGLSAEVIEKLNVTQPGTLGQAGRVPGVTPAALSLLLVHAKKKGWSDVMTQGGC